eukprot:Awhi_evm1s1094
MKADYKKMEDEGFEVLSVSDLSEYSKTVTKTTEKRSQLASKVLAVSSQYNTTTWGAHQCLGPARVYPQYGDIGQTWAQKKTRSSFEYIVLQFDESFAIEGLELEFWETYGCGAITKISCLPEEKNNFEFTNFGFDTESNYDFYFNNTESKYDFQCNNDFLDKKSEAVEPTAFVREAYVDFEEVWSSPEPHLISKARIFKPELELEFVKSPKLFTKTILVEINCSKAESWYQLDSVRMTGQTVDDYTEHTSQLDCTRLGSIASDVSKMYLDESFSDFSFSLPDVLISLR